MPGPITPVNEWTDVTSVADGDLGNAASINATAVQSLANRTAWIDGVLRASNNLASPPTRSLVLSAAVMTPIRLTGTPAIPAYSAGGVWDLSESTLALWCPLNKFVPFGAQLSGVDLLMSASTKSAAGTLSLMLLPVNFATPTWGDGGGSAITVASDTTSGTGAQVLTVGSWTIDDANQPLFALYTPGTITSGIDQIAALRLRFTDPGPRNF